MIKNSITMCTRCNNQKGNKLPTQEFIEKYGCAYDPEYLGRALIKQADNPPLAPRVRTVEELAEKERRRQEWLKSASGLAWLTTRAGLKYLANVGKTKEHFV